MGWVKGARSTVHGVFRIRYGMAWRAQEVWYRYDGPFVVAYSLTELVAPIRTARGVGNPVSLIAGISSVSRVGRGWALEGDQNCKSIQRYGGIAPLSGRWVP